MKRAFQCDDRTGVRTKLSRVMMTEPRIVNVCGVHVRRTHLRHRRSVASHLAGVAPRASGYKDAETPPFELYDERFDVAIGDGGREIWFPVKAA
jgi:hypothetical protein